MVPNKVVYAVLVMGTVFGWFLRESLIPKEDKKSDEKEKSNG